MKFPDFVQPLGLFLSQEKYELSKLMEEEKKLSFTI